MTDEFTYVSVLPSIIVALALTDLLAGMANILKLGRVKVSLVHFSWLGILLFMCVDYWFFVWDMHEIKDWPSGLVLFLLILSTPLYLSCRLIVPETGGKELLDLKTFHDENRRKYLAPLLIYVGLCTYANFNISDPGTKSLLYIFMMILIAIAWLWRDARVQIIVVVAFALLTIYYARNFTPYL